MVTLSLNGEPLAIDSPVNLSSLLKKQGYQAQKIAVAINGEFVPRSQYDHTEVSEGDNIDIIQAVGGG